MRSRKKATCQIPKPKNPSNFPLPALTYSLTLNPRKKAGFEYYSTGSGSSVAIVHGVTVQEEDSMRNY